MTPQERELLSNLFDRLRQCEGNPKEPDAAALIADAVARQPDAPYFMAQLLLVQDQALSAAQARIRTLEQAAETAGKAAQQTAVPSFLPETRQRQAEPPRGPSGAYRPSVPEAGPARTQGNAGYPGPASPQPQPAVGSGGGFLRGALQTAAVVAGGALLFEGISSLFHQGGMPWGLGGSGFLPSGTGPTLIEETVINENGQPQHHSVLRGSIRAPSSRPAMPLTQILPEWRICPQMMTSSATPISRRTWIKRERRSMRSSCRSSAGRLDPLLSAPLRQAPAKALKCDQKNREGSSRGSFPPPVFQCPVRRHGEGLYLSVGQGAAANSCPLLPVTAIARLPVSPMRGGSSQPFVPPR